MAAVTSPPLGSRTPAGINSPTNAKRGVLDLSFMELNEVGDVKDALDTSSGARLRPTCLKLNDNSLAGIDELPRALASAGVEGFEDMFWLDVSCNEISSLPADLATQFPSLSSLNLHGNQLKALSEVKKLSYLKGLHKLTLHGNPLCENKHYRNYVLHFLPNLQSLDFTRITGRDREASTVWAYTFRNKLLQDDESQSS